MDKALYPAYYMHDGLPYLIARQNGLTDFDAFDPKKKEWVEDRDLFQRVCLDCDYHRISEEDANKVIQVLSGDVEGLDADQLIEKINEVYADNWAMA